VINLISMKQLFREIIGFLIRYSGISYFMREVYAKRKVSILLYHDPKPDVLNTHLAYLGKRYKFVTLDTLVNAMYSKDWSNVPPKSLVITLDDGCKGNLALIGVFKKYGVIPTIYMCSQIVNSNRHFWFKIPEMKSHRVVRELVKEYTNGNRLDFLKREFDFDNSKTYAREERQALSMDEIVTMKDLISFQSHTRFHPVLTTCSDDECEREIRLSKKEIEMIVGKECKLRCAVYDSE